MIIGAMLLSTALLMGPTLLIPKCPVADMKVRSHHMHPPTCSSSRLVMLCFNRAGMYVYAHNSPQTFPEGKPAETPLLHVLVDGPTSGCYTGWQFPDRIPLC